MRHTLKTAACTAAAALTASLLAATTTPASVAAAPAEPAWPAPAAPLALEITTDGGVPVTSKDDYVDATFTLAGQTYETEIKGRGNSTWGWPKKPYKLKLEEDASILGMPATNEWVLLANYADRSALRNYLAFELASRTRLAWTPRTRFVTVTLNGAPQGLYVLTEQVELGESRVDLPEDGHLLEIDERFRAAGDPGFRSARGTAVAFKDPDELTRRQRRAVKDAVADFEAVLWGKDFADPDEGYASMIDVDSVIDWYLVEELFHNQDSNFYSSVFVEWVPGEGFAMGPVWDFDQSAGTRWSTTSAPEGFHTRYGRHWISRMFQDPVFSAKVAQRWRELRPSVDAMIDHVDTAAAVVETAAEQDHALWPTSTHVFPNGIHAADFDGEVDFLEGWLERRRAWMNQSEAIFGRSSWLVEEKPRTVWVPVRIFGDHSSPVRVRYRHAGGKAQAGVDFRMSPGTLTFAPGESVRAIPVQLLGDRVAEGAEGIKLALEPDQGVRVGNPTKVKLTIAASDQRSDTLVRFGRRGFKGDDVYNRRGKRQTVTTRARPGQRRAFVVRVANDGTRRVQYTVKARAPRGVTVRYFAGKREVTDALTSRRGWKVSVKVDRHRQLRAVVRVRPGARSGVRRVVRIKSVWRGERRMVDTVGAAVRVR